jgi:hypothetical protein
MTQKVALKVSIILNASNASLSKNFPIQAFAGVQANCMIN